MVRHSSADGVAGDADVARVAALIGDRTRARVLMALADGRALPAGVLASEAGVTVMAALLDQGLLIGGDGRHHRDGAAVDRLSAPGGDVGYRLTSHGRSRLTTFGVDLPAPGRERRAIRYCVDWSEQRHHLAGPLGAALTDRMFDLGWLRRTDQRRVVHLTEAGRHGLHDTFGVPEDWDERA